MARPARNDDTPLDAAMPVALYLELRGDAADAARLDTHAAVFCDAHPQATLHRPRARPPHLSDTAVVAYIVVDGGPLRGAISGEAAARRAMVTFAAAVTELFMFAPVLVPCPAGLQPPAADAPDRPREEHHESADRRHSSTSPSIAHRPRR